MLYEVRIGKQKGEIRDEALYQKREMPNEAVYGKTQNAI